MTSETKAAAEQTSFLSASRFYAVILLLILCVFGLLMSGGIYWLAERMKAVIIAGTKVQTQSMTDFMEPVWVPVILLVTALCALTGMTVYLFTQKKIDSQSSKNQILERWTAVQNRYNAIKNFLDQKNFEVSGQNRELLQRKLKDLDEVLKGFKDAGAAPKSLDKRMSSAFLRPQESPVVKDAEAILKS